LKPNEKVNSFLLRRDLLMGTCEGPGVDYRNELAKSAADLLGFSFVAETSVSMPEICISPTRSILITSHSLTLTEGTKYQRKELDYAVPYEEKSLKELADETFSLLLSISWVNSLSLIVQGSMLNEEE
jgi:hypothetical protein